MPSSLYATPYGVLVFLGGGTLLLLVLLKTVGEWLAPLLFTYTLAVTLDPLVRRLEARGLPHGLAVTGVFLGAFVVAGVAIAFVTAELQLMAQRIPQYQAMLTGQLAPLLARFEALGVDTRTLLAGGALSPSALARGALDLISMLLARTASLMLFLFLLLLMAMESPAVGRAFSSRLPPQSALIHRYHAFQHEVQTQYRLATLSNFISAVVLTIAYLGFRLDFAFLWGLLTFFLSYIPRFGMLVSFIPPVIVALIQYGGASSLWLLVLVLLINGLMDNVITPRLTGKGLGIRTLAVATSAIVWLWVFGPLGALLSVSLTLFLRMILASTPQTLPLAYALSTEDYAPPEPPTPERPQPST